MRMALPMNGIAKPLLLAAGLVVLAGCSGDVSRSFGFTRDPPDEFQVATRAPLSVPPNFDLRPPRPGATRPQEGPTRDQAAAVLAGRQGIVVGSPPPVASSAGESALLAAAGPAPGPNLRRQLDEENTLLESRDRGFTDRLLFWRTPEQPGIALDPAREQRRLRENAALGLDQTVGDTPIIQRRRRGLLESIF